MIVNQQNLHGLNVAYSTAYNKAFQGRKTQYERIATVVPSTTASTDYKCCLLYTSPSPRD